MKKRQEARSYLQDLYLFDKEVLGYSEMEEQPHRLMCDSASNRDNKRKLHLWPRGHFKSSDITVGYTVQRICEDPNIRVFVGNAILDNSQSFLREIKGHFETNEKLRHYYGNHVSDSKDPAGKWTDSQIISAQRTVIRKEPTVQAAGVGKSLASQHYDLMILDDLVDQTSVTTPEQIAKVQEWYKLALSLLDPDGELIIIGTRYHQNDLYGYIIKELADLFDIQVHSVFIDDDETKGTIFPTRFTPEHVAKLRKEQGSYVFSCQNRNKPVSDENAKFKVSDFRYYKEDEMEQHSLYTTMTVDRAYSLTKTADFTGITVRSVDLDGNRYVRYAKRHKQQEKDIVKAIFDLRNYYNVDRVGVEQKAFKHTLRPVLDEEMRRRGEFFEVVELKDLASKLLRIESLIPQFESHSVRFLEGEMTDLEDELTNFPMASHDDLADALAYHDVAEMKGAPGGSPEIIGYEQGLGGVDIPVYGF